MKRSILSAALLAAVVAALSPAQAKTRIVLKPANVTLPDSKRALPQGPGLETVKTNCLTCHSAGMILVQPRMSGTVWAAEVTKMRNVYKAPIDEKDVKAIVEYLTAVRGPK